MSENKQAQQIDISVEEATAEGIYSNLALISHSTSEFVIDFVRLMPGTPKAKVKSRIILTPENAKRLLFLMQENMAKYEANFGEIKMPKPPIMAFGGGNA